MPKAGLLPLIFLLFTAASGQNKTSLELSVLGRYDRHANYVSNYAGRAYNDSNKLYGRSYGVGITYKKEIANSISASIGLGYYRLGIDKIKGSMPFNMPGTRTARNIDYDDGSSNLLYSTSKYWYNNFMIAVGLSKTVRIKERLYVDIGVEGTGYYSFSQRYRLFEGPDYYSTSHSKPIEFGANTSFGILKEYSQFYIRPALIVPVYQRLKGDQVFYEDRNMNISKWFNGIGFMLRAGIYI